jgi:hypothetical protein
MTYAVQFMKRLNIKCLISRANGSGCMLRVEQTVLNLRTLVASNMLRWKLSLRNRNE